VRHLATLLGAAALLVSCTTGADRGADAGGASAVAAAPLPEPRTEVAGAAWRGGIVAGGGLLPDRSASARVDLYDPTRDAWNRLPDLPRALHHHGFAVVDGELWVVGGYEAQGDQWLPTDRAWRLAAPDGDWQQAPSLTVPRGGLAVVGTDDGVWAIGGVGATGTHRSTERLVDGAWIAGPDLAETREHLAAAARGDEIVVIAGRDGGMPTNRVTTEFVTADGARPGPDLAVARGGTSAATIGSTVCVAGGETPDGTVAEVECLDGDTWSTAAHLGEPRHGLAVVALDGHLHVIGGGPTPGLSVSGAHEVFRIP
jgi:non-specific serine/threonine protein kinase